MGGLTELLPNTSVLEQVAASLVGSWWQSKTGRHYNEDNPRSDMTRQKLDDHDIKDEH